MEVMLKAKIDQSFTNENKFRYIDAYVIIDAHKGGGRWLGRVEGSKIVYPLAILSEKQEAFRLSTVCTYGMYI
jgi:hypothetical protein